MEERRHLRVDLRVVMSTCTESATACTHLLDGSRLLLVRLQDLQEGLVRLWILREPVLDLVDVVDGVVELHDGRLGDNGVRSVVRLC